MKFSKFLRNVNRGIVLLIVTALCFAGYVAYDYVMFKKEKPEIEALVREYVENIPQLIMLPESEQKYQNVSADAVNKKLEDNDKLLSQYWTPNSANVKPTYISSGLAEVKATIKSALQSTVEKDKNHNGIILDCKVMIKQVRNIKKISPGVAEAEIEFSISYDFKGNPLLYSGSAIGNECPTADEPVSDDKIRTTKFTHYGTEFSLTKTSGGWKISDVTSNMFGIEPVAIKEGGGE